MKKKTVLFILICIICMYSIGCNTSNNVNTAKEKYNIAYVSFYIPYNDANISTLSGDNAKFYDLSDYTSGRVSSSENVSTYFYLRDWDYGNNDTIILYLLDGRTLQTSASNVVLMNESAIAK